MTYIDERTVRNLTSKVTYDRGVSYYEEGKVSDVVVKNIKEEATLEIYTLIQGKIKSSDNNKSYNASVHVTEYGGIVDVNCDCQAFSNYFSAVGICKHVVALLLQHIKDEKRIIEVKGGSKQINKILELLNLGVVDKENINKSLNLHYILNEKDTDSNMPSLELKVGEDHLYVVRDLKEFLETAENKDRNINFGKNFTYNPKAHSFHKVDESIINILLEIYEIDKNLSQLQKGNSSSKLLRGKRALLADNQLKRILHSLKGAEIEYRPIYGATTLMRVSEEDIPLEFHICEEDEFIYIKQKGQSVKFITRDGQFVIYNNTIYYMQDEKAKVFNAFYNLYGNKINNTIKFDIKDKEELGAYVVPNLKLISSNINIDASISKEFYEEPLMAEVYFDKRYNGISLELKFKYGDVGINPLKPSVVHSSRGILIRNIKKELELMQSIIDYGFKKEGSGFLLLGDEKTVDFIQNKVEDISRLGQVYYSEEFKNLKLYTNPTIVSKVRLNEENFLQFNFSINDVEREELRDLMSAVIEKKKYYKLRKGGFIPLESKEVQDLSNMIKYLNVKGADLQKENITLPNYNALYIDELMKDKRISIETNERFDKLVQSIKDIKSVDFIPNKDLNKIMRDYQKVGFRWFKTLSSCNLGGILADEMGLGKTLQAIAFIESEVNEKEDIPTIVIAPTSLVYNWKDEIDKFAPQLNTLVIAGGKRERAEKLKRVKNYNIILTSYPLIRRDIEEYKEISFKYCFLDEAQNIKNPSSINSKAVKEIKARSYFALTGTPIENSLTELWSIFDFIMPGYLMNHSKFMENYEIPIVKDKDTDVLAELNRHIKPFILRRLKKDVLSQLPPKIEHKVLIEMTKEQKKLYAAYLSKFKEDMSIEINEKGFKKSTIKILSMLTRLRQICDDPSIFLENYKGDSGKMEALLNILEESISNNHRILLFSQFTSVLKNIEKILLRENIEYMYLDGGTKMEDRVNLVKEFNGGRGSVFLISLKAGGTGLNLTGADTVIHFDPWWNPAVEDQATDRAHRIGQKSTVEVIKLISRGTIEEKIFTLQEKKREIINSVIDTDIYEENLISQLSEEELKDLFT